MGRQLFKRQGRMAAWRGGIALRLCRQAGIDPFGCNAAASCPLPPAARPTRLPAACCWAGLGCAEPRAHLALTHILEHAGGAIGVARTHCTQAGRRRKRRMGCSVAERCHHSVWPRGGPTAFWCDVQGTAIGSTPGRRCISISISSNNSHSLAGFSARSSAACWPWPWPVAGAEPASALSTILTASTRCRQVGWGSRIRCRHHC